MRKALIPRGISRLKVILLENLAELNPVVPLRTRKSQKMSLQIANLNLNPPKVQEFPAAREDVSLLFRTRRRDARYALSLLEGSPPGVM